MTENELATKAVQIATQVIIHAGNARTLIQHALKAASDGYVDVAEEKLNEANEEIRSAHRTQTDVIQAEARGENLPHSLLLTHAQDTLMIAISEGQMAKHIIKLYLRLNDLPAD
jgi:PTS system cellobiose-specific IIA component